MSWLFLVLHYYVNTMLWLLIQSLIVNSPNITILSLAFLFYLFFSGFLIMLMVQSILVYEASTIRNSTSKCLRLPLVIRMLIVEFLQILVHVIFILYFFNLSVFPCLFSCHASCYSHEVTACHTTYYSSKYLWCAILIVEVLCDASCYSHKVLLVTRRCKYL